MEQGISMGAWAGSVVRYDFDAASVPVFRYPAGLMECSSP